MIVGIECTAHTFGVGIVHKKKILANVRDMYKPIRGGIVPVEAGKHHRNVAESLYKQALREAHVDENNIVAIALSNAPGLAPCLLAGLTFAKEKAKMLNVPIVPVNHCISHLEIGRHEGALNPVLLYVSGANTQVIAFISEKYRVFGETLDIGVGNFIDKFARYAEIPFPGGPKIEQEAKQGTYVELPYTIKGMDVSFSGMQTKLQQLFDRGIPFKDLAFSLQETAFAMLVEAAERALAHTGKRELVLGGGVACNARLQEMCRVMCRERKAKFFCPPREFLVDNGAMIAYTGDLMFNADVKEKAEKVDIKPRERTDDVAVLWR